MRAVAKLILVALPVVIIGMMFYFELPEFRRYLRMKRM